ncbi:hypothetical protein [Nitratidesulfovibrio liaohensis]|uniref:Permuted papain-like amidase enzyme, YaeF/YiiX, C92 family n=1 Tax=Nitratidesulfovibrio liaohensis TaxID=2604158 RepID=A0ABY9R1V0_9BACT|nr:hypothetical protein [Nitratidesulfovibrio liaohensis]WMW65741.1 hypothetical protein KPS_000249 [Nitratidesulfovibrio liaohensis]
MKIYVKTISVMLAMTIFTATFSIASSQKNTMENQIYPSANFILEVGGEITPRACWKINIASRPIDLSLRTNENKFKTPSLGHAFIIIENNCIDSEYKISKAFGAYPSGITDSKNDYTQREYTIAITTENMLASEIYNNMAIISDECKIYGTTPTLRRILGKEKKPEPKAHYLHKLGIGYLPIANDCTNYAICIANEIFEFDMEKDFLLPKSLLEKMYRMAYYISFKNTKPQHDSCPLIRSPLSRDYTPHLKTLFNYSPSAIFPIFPMSLP